MRKISLVIFIIFLTSCGKSVPIPNYAPGTPEYVNRWLIEKENVPAGCEVFVKHESREVQNCVENFNFLVEGREIYATKVDIRGRDIKFGQFGYWAYGPLHRPLPDGTYCVTATDCYYGQFIVWAKTIFYGPPAVLRHEIIHAIDFTLNPNLITDKGNYRYSIIDHGTEDDPLKGK